MFLPAGEEASCCAVQQGVDVVVEGGLALQLHLQQHRQQQVDDVAVAAG